MWLPDSIYDRVPQFWLLMGLLFFAFGLYLGFEFELIFVYLGLGVFCVGRSIWIYKIRAQYRKLTFTTIQQAPQSVDREDRSQEPPAHTAS